MSTRKIKVNGNLTKFAFDKTKKYKYDSSGDLVEATTIADDDIVLSGSKSSLRRMADMERNISILATKTVTSAGALDLSIGEVSGLQTALSAHTSADTALNNRLNTIEGSGTGSVAKALVDAKAYTDSEITDLLGGAPAAYDTLNEIRNAMATDSELSTAISNISNVPSASKWQTARTLTLTGDASGSVSWDGSANATLSVTVANDSHIHTHLQDDVATETPDNALQYFQTSGNTSINPSTDWYNTIRMGHGDPTTYYSNTIAVKMTGDSTGDIYTRTIANGNAGSWNRFWHSNNDGGGSGLDADTVDGIHASSFLRSDADNTLNGVLTVNTTNDAQIQLTSADTWTGIGFNDAASAAVQYIWHNGGHGTFAIGGGGSNVSGKKLHVDGGLSVGVSSDNTATPTQGIYSQGEISVAGSTVWHGGNDGSGSGLDADLLDGKQASSFTEVQATFRNGATNFDSLKTSGFHSLYNANASGHTNAPFQYGAMISAGNTADGGGMAMQIAHERIGAGTYIRGMNDTGDTWSPWREIWTSGTDGAGSGLDADLLDGVQGSSYLRSDASDSFTSLSGTSISLSGSLVAAGDITAYSDDSLKTNIQVIDGALGKVKAVRGVTFDRIEDGSTSTGVVAQELQAVLPEAVHTDDAGIHSVAYGNVIGLLIEAVKELSDQVEDLKNK